MYTTTQHTPSQLVFVIKAVINIKLDTNRLLIKQHKLAFIVKGNQNKNYNGQPQAKVKQNAYVASHSMTENRYNVLVYVYKENIMNTFDLQNITLFKK